MIDLNPAHFRVLRESALSDASIEVMGCRSVPREEFASLDVMEVLQWTLAGLHLSHHVWPIIVAINPVHWPGKRPVMTHIADLQKGVHGQCGR